MKSTATRSRSRIKPGAFPVFNPLWYPSSFSMSSMENVPLRSPSKRRSYHFVLGIKFEHYEVESVPDALEVRLPSLFSMQHRHQIPIVVVLFDHRGNEFEVAVCKRGSDVYLTQGWRQVGRCLGLHDGGWLKMIYVTASRFFIEARDRLFNAPLCLAPPRYLSLTDEPRMISPAEAAAAPIDPSVYVGRKPTCVMSFYGTLTSADVNTPFLHLPADFCNVIFPTGDCDITFVGDDGRAWTCSLVFPVSSNVTDVFVRGWGTIVDAYNLEEGYAYKLDVPVETTNLVFFGGH